MVAKIESGKSLKGALYYNENKVKLGKAELLEVRGYLKEAEYLNFNEKLFRLKDLAERNGRVKTNTVHISLNFDVNEYLPKETLIDLTDSYMDKLGFSRQPYLIYRHTDAGHPHIHIVTTNIEAGGDRISLHNIGKFRSEPARREIEMEFGLVRAESKKGLEIGAAKIKPLIYGQTDTRRGISTIVQEVTRSYKFSSLPELNAVLGFFNVLADRGPKESTMFKNKGLRYWVLDEAGNKVGVPIKASSIHKKPTLRLLQDRFILNEYLKKTFKEALKAKIDQALLCSSTRSQYELALKKLSVEVVFRENKEGRLYGITYVDQENKTVFNGSDIGKKYSAATLMYHPGQCKDNNSPDPCVSDQQKLSQLSLRQYPENLHPRKGLLDELLGDAESGCQIPSELTRKKRKKYKRMNL